MRKIIVGFSRPIKPAIFAKAIMWADGIKYSHVYIKWSWSNIDRDIIYQASKFAVNFESNITFDSHAIAVEEYEITISDECFRTVMQFCMDHSNRPYGVKEILGFAYVKALGFMKIKVKNPFPSNGQSYICSKIAAEIVDLTNVIDITEDSDNIDPLYLNTIFVDAVKKSIVKRIT